MAIDLLPDIGETHSTTVSSCGTWVSDERNTLSSLVKDLGNQTKQKLNITSIPDMWAHPKVCEIVLGNQQHGAHERYRNQWRGVIALLALREMRGISNIKLQTIDVPEMNTPEAEKGNDFAKIITRLLDKDYKKFADPSTNVNYPYKLQIFVVEKNNECKPLAIVWPRILVCPAIDLAKLELSTNAIPWWNNGSFVDPCGKGMLGAAEKCLLLKWLKKLHDYVMDKVRNNEPGLLDAEEKPVYGNRLLDLLDSFIEDLKIAAKEDNLEEEPELKDGAGVGVTGFAAPVDVPIAMEVDEQDFIEASNVCINSHDGKKKVLLVLPNISEDWQIANSDIIVAGNVNMEMLSQQLASKKELDKENLKGTVLADYNAELWTVDDFFTSKIAIVPDKDANDSEEGMFPNILKPIKSKKKSDSFIIPPINSKVLEYLDQDYIVNNLEITREDNRNVTVDLVVRVSGKRIENQNRVVEFVHVIKTYDYNMGEVLDTFVEMPLIQVWPNFITKKGDKNNWQAYFSLYDYYPNPANEAAKSPNKDYKILYTRPYWEDVSMLKLEEPGKHTEIIRGTEFPEVYICSAVDEFDENRDGSVSEECICPSADPKRQSVVGLLFIKKPKLVSEEDLSVTIGIDFGTTNTISYIADGNDKGDRRVLRFVERVYSITTKEAVPQIGKIKMDEDELQEYNRFNELRRYFFPASEQPFNIEGKEGTSVRTIFHDYKSNFDGNEERALIRGNVYYMEGANSLGLDDSIKSKIHGDIKWDMQKENKQRIQGFLYQYCMQCLAEAVALGAKNVNWSFSYPKAFSKSQINDLDAFWKGSLLESLNEVSNISTQKAITKKSESLAMSQFFREKYGDMVGTKGMVCFDIGGGSTDIAIWYADKLKPCHQCSLRLAGSNILSKYLYYKKATIPNLFSNLRTRDDAFNQQLDAVTAAKQYKYFNLELEALLKYHENNIFKSLGVNSYDPDLYIVLRDIAFALAGIFFYTGTVVAYLLKDKNNKYTNDESLPNCYIGGNASKLLEWAAKGNYKASDLNLILLNCFYYGIVVTDENIIGDDFDLEDIEVVKSDEPKQEVAYGLVCKDESRIRGEAEKPKIMKGLLLNKKGPVAVGGAVDADDEFVVAGESYTFNGEGAEALALTAEDFNSDKGYIKVDKQTPVFAQFVEVFNALIQNTDMFQNCPIDFGKKMTFIRNTVNQELMDKCEQGAANSNDVELEPIFIMELRKALSVLSGEEG